MIEEQNNNWGEVIDRINLDLESDRLSLYAAIIAGMVEENNQQIDLSDQTFRILQGYCKENVRKELLIIKQPLGITIIFAP
jgi:hypothetical protein